MPNIAQRVNEKLGVQSQPSTGKSMAQIVNDSYQKGKESYQPVVLTPKSNEQKNLTTNTAAPTITYTTANFILPGCSILVLIIALVLFIKNKRLQQKTSTQASIQQTHINNPQKKKNDSQNQRVILYEANGQERQKKIKCIINEAPTKKAPNPMKIKRILKNIIIASWLTYIILQFCFFVPFKTFEVRQTYAGDFKYEKEYLYSGTKIDTLWYDEPYTQINFPLLLTQAGVVTVVLGTLYFTLSHNIKKEK